MDFIYDDYKKIINLLLRNNYGIIKYRDDTQYSKKAILRHDVDISLEKAVEFAQYEKALDVKSTYFILLNSKLYNIFNKNSIEMIMHIKELGHDIGLHFDETNYALPSAYDERNEKIKELIIHEKNVMEKIIPGIKIESVSMHMPSKQTLEADLHFEDNFINSYSCKFFKKHKYISDSNMHRRENIYETIASGQYDNLHILTHPIWYDVNYNSKTDKISKLLLEKKNMIYNEVCNISPGIEDDIKLEDF